jgi:hypothetical protein
VRQILFYFLEVVGLVVVFDRYALPKKITEHIYYILVWFGLSIGSKKWNREPNQTTLVFNWFGLVFDPNHKIGFFRFGLVWIIGSIGFF